MIVSLCYLSSVKSSPPRKAENQMDYDCFSSRFKESYMTQGKKNKEQQWNESLTSDLALG